MCSRCWTTSSQVSHQLYCCMSLLLPAYILGHVLSGRCAAFETYDMPVSYSALAWCSWTRAPFCNKA